MKKLVIVESILLSLCLIVLGYLYHDFGYFIKLPKQARLEINNVENIVREIDNLISTSYYYKKDNKYLIKSVVEGYMKGLGDPYAAYYLAEEADGYIADSSIMTAEIATFSEMSVLDNSDKTLTYRLDYERNIGFLTIKSFKTGLANKFKEVIDYFDNNKVNAIVVDLRNNPGGWTIECLRMLDYLIEEPNQKLLYYELDNQGHAITKSFYYTKDNHKVDIPFIILTNSNTASAAELFTQCLRDYRKCFVIGEKTFGKGITQANYVLRDGSMIRYTTAKYKTRSMYEIQGNGIYPDIFHDMSNDMGLNTKIDKCIAGEYDFLLAEDEM